MGLIWVYIRKESQSRVEPLLVEALKAAVASHIYNGAHRRASQDPSAASEGLCSRE